MTGQTLLLRKLASVQVPGTKEFVTKDHLESSNIGWTGNNFKTHFLDKIEGNVGDAVIVVHGLKRVSLDDLILAELEDRAEIRLVHFFALLQKQSKGENGPLFIDGFINGAYIKGNDNNLWAVFAIWLMSCGFWVVEARLIKAPYRWAGGSRILSRDS